MDISNYLKKSAKVALSSAMFLSALGLQDLAGVAAQERAEGTTLATVESATAKANVVDVTFNGGDVKGRITFLENDVFRYNVDPSEEFSQWATPWVYSQAGDEAGEEAAKRYDGRIQAQEDTSSKYSKPNATVNETSTAFEITNGYTTIVLDKTTAKMSIKNAANTVVMEEAEPLQLGSTTYQNLVTSDNEYFFGGGTQNGRFTHKGQRIHIANESSWVDGGVSSPNPFYWSSKGYGVLRNTFKPGWYDFGKSDEDVVTAEHNENEFDAYYFVSDENNVAQTAESLLQGYFKVTGNPLLLPEYAFYLSHLNCYNRDGWYESAVSGSYGWKMEDGNTSYETGRGTGYVIKDGEMSESLNNTGPTVDASLFKGAAYSTDTYKYSARAVIDGHEQYDMPLGWFLPNDGYGCGYGQNGYYQAKDRQTTTDAMTKAIDANVANLQSFTDYAESKGVRTGLWTQAALTPQTSLNDGGYQGLHTLRDFNKEVNTAGVSALKTDVAWVGAGYAMAMDSVQDGYNILSTSGKRPTVVSLDGWAGFQRYASVWTGDQTGGNWEYIRFHIPTYIGQSLSGNPNIGSDVDGIFGGSDLITTRDLQFKTFTQTMLDMDGWGNIAKKPYGHGDPYTAINRMYLKLKAQFMPYIYTEAINASTGLPMIRAMFLEEANDYTYSTKTQYQYMFGENLLVAPVYQDTAADADGNDIRNNIYLPGTSDIWIDYFTGEQYRGGQVLNNFDAPIWKLPLFVKNGAIIPMYEENNNPMAKTSDNAKGLDKTRRIIEFYPSAKAGTKGTSYTLKEDDGITMDMVDGTPNYGGTVTTKLTSAVDGNVATLTAGQSSGSYAGYDSNRHSTFVVNVSAKPSKVTIQNGSDAAISSDGALTEAASLEEFNEKAAKNEAVWFYDETPNLNKYAMDSEAFKSTKIETTPKVYVSFPEFDVNSGAQVLTVEGFVNDGNLGEDKENSALTAPTGIGAPEDDKTPTSIKVKWNAVSGATSYEVEADGTINSVGSALFYENTDLAYNSTHRYRVRARNADGYSAWSDYLETKSKEDPWRNTPDPVKITWTGDIWGAHTANLAFDKILQTGDGGFHSNGGGINETLTVDYGKAYEFETIEYYPRDDGKPAGNANGTVTRMEFSHSLDGVHWSEPEFYDWDINADVKTITVNDAARYIKFIPRASVSVFFSAREIKVITKEGKRPIEVGSTKHNDEITETDYSNMTNYLGGNMEDPNFPIQIKNYYGDINRNNIYDVYDYSFVMFKIDGGTKKTGSVSGSALLLASGDTIKAGETFTVDVYADNVKNLNAIGAIINYDKTKIQYTGLEQGVSIAQMTNLSIAKDYNGGSSYVNLAFANRGDKPTFNGTGVVATVTFTAKQDIDTRDTDVIDLSTATIIGPNFSFANTVNEAPEIPEVPEETVTKYGLNNMSVKITNAAYPTDDGTNVESMIAQKSYNSLFDGAFMDRGFELKYCNPTGGADTKLPDCATIDTKLPVTLHFEMNQPIVMSDGAVYNAQAGSNGFVTEASYKVYYDDGTDSGEQSIVLADTDQVDGAALRMKMDPSKKVTKVDFTILKDKKDTKAQFTLSEVEFLFKDKAVKPTAIAPADTNAEEIYVGQLSAVDAVVTPEEALNKYFTVESSDSSVATILALADANGNPVYKVKGNKPGTATITLTSAADKTVKATYEITVKEGIDISNLEKAIEEAKAVEKSLYTDESYAKVAEALDAAVELLNSDSYTRADVENAASAIRQAIADLEVRPLPTGNLINTSKDTDITIIDYSSDATGLYEGETGLVNDVLDYNEATYWHSSYAEGQKKMPQWLTFDLGKLYKMTDVTFLTRPGALHGDITKAEILTSVDGKNFTSVGVYTFEEDGNHHIVNRNEYQRMQFAAVKARYIKLNILGSTGNPQYNQNDEIVSISELRFYGTPTVDDIALRELYNEYKDAENENYTPASWAAFQNALADAEDVLNKENASKDEVDTVYARLQKAIEGLSEKANLSALKAAIAKAEKVDTSKYTSATVKKLNDAVKKAKKVLSDPNATQKEVDAATKSVNDAIKALKKNSGKDPSNPIKPNPSLKPGYVDHIVNNVNNVIAEGIFPENVQLIVEDLAADVKAKIIDSIKNKDDVAKYNFEKIFDIYMLRKGVSYTPNGSFTIKIKLDDELLAKRYLGIVYISDDGEATTIPSKIENGYITFKTSHNSYYAIVSSDSPIVNTATSTTMPVSSAPAFILLGAVLIFVTKKMEKVLED